MSQSIVSRLAKWGSCDVADGLSKLGYAHGGFLEGLHMFSPEYRAGNTKIVGQAWTVKFAVKTDRKAPKVEGSYIDQIPRDAIVFISQPAPHINACYGGLMSLRAKKLGAVGVVIDGSFRDLQEQRNLEMPLFARSTGTTAGGAVCFPSEINVPVKLQSSIQKATIHPGDYIIADLDGVVCLPASQAERVLELIPELVAADQRCAKAIEAGMTVQEAFATFRGKTTADKAPPSNGEHGEVKFSSALAGMWH